MATRRYRPPQLERDPGEPRDHTVRLEGVARSLGVEVERNEDVTAFCRRLHSRLVGALGLHCGDRRVAEELAQETLARVWERWPTVRAADSPEAWTFRVAFNLANSRLRRHAAEKRAYGRMTARRNVPDTPSTADAIAVREAVASLPPRQRAVIVLRYFADCSVEDTATAMHCATGTVKSLTSRAIDGLRARLGDSVDALSNAEGAHDARPS
jgi:RNA polymerase sigma-70 factor (sigma-E family)